jgi:hypothetical protein
VRPTGARAALPEFEGSADNSPPNQLAELERRADSGLAVATDLATFLLGEATPDAAVLIRVQGELEALRLGRALEAYPLGGCDLVECYPGRADREEQ